MLGVVPDEGPVLVEVPHEVVVIIELAQGHHGVSAGQQGAGRTVALGNKFIILVLYFQRKFQISSKNIVCHLPNEAHREGLLLCVPGARVGGGELLLGVCLWQAAVLRVPSAVELAVLAAVAGLLAPGDGVEAALVAHRAETQHRGQDVEHQQHAQHCVQGIFYLE